MLINSGVQRRHGRLILQVSWVLILILISSVLSEDKKGTDTDVSEKNAGDKNAENVRNKRLIIGIIEAEPYSRMVPKSNGRQYIGYLPDLISILSRRLGFEYDYRQMSATAHKITDNTNPAWSVMRDELLKREKSYKENRSDSEGIDLAAAVVSITSERQKKVSFIKPFLRMGMTVLIKKPTFKDSDPELEIYFNVIQAFDPVVWILAIVSGLLVGILLWLMNKYNPYDYGRRFEIGLADKTQAESFNLRGALWFVFTTMQWQGFERAPRSIASKFLSGIWFIFVTVFLATFTASIMSKLFFASLEPPSREIPRSLLPQDLAHLLTSTLHPYKCGAVQDSQAADYVMNAAVGQEFQAIKSYWETSEGRELLVGNLTSGLDRVRSDDYALIVERMVANYHLNRRPCDLMTVGSDFGVRSYGMALPKNSPYLEDFHKIILHLEEEGELEQLQKRWFVDKGECWNDTSRLAGRRSRSMLEGAQQPKTMDTASFSAALGLIVLGLTVSAVIALAEMLYYTYRGRYSSSMRGNRRHTLRLENEEPSSQIG